MSSRKQSHGVKIVLELLCSSIDVLMAAHTILPSKTALATAGKLGRPNDELRVCSWKSSSDLISPPAPTGKDGQKVRQTGSECWQMVASEEVGCWLPFGLTNG